MWFTAYYLWLYIYLIQICLLIHKVKPVELHKVTCSFKKKIILNYIHCNAAIHKVL